MNQTNINKGEIYGVDHFYIIDGVWARCDCGSEILEILQSEHFTVSNQFEYQIRCFSNHYINEEDFSHACFVCEKTDINCIIDVLKRKAHSFSTRTEKDSDYWFELSYDDKDLLMMEWVNFSITKKCDKKNKTLWEVCLTPKTAEQIANKLRKMIKNEEEKYGKM